MPIPSFIFSDPLAFHLPALAGWLRRYEAIAAHAAVNIKIEGQPKALSLADFVNARRDYKVTPEGVALVHINGALSRDATGFDRLFGDTHYNDVIRELDQASADPKVSSVLLEISSPGGSVVGAPETAAAVAAVRAKGKPVVAYIEVIGCSAAYYVAAAANAIIASPSAIVGSIGTIATFQNLAGMLARLGVEVTMLTPEKADLKAAGNPWREMTADEKEFLQSRIERLNAEFTGWVKQHRPKVKDDAMRGQWFSGTDALAAGLVDSVGAYASALRTIHTAIPARFLQPPIPTDARPPTAPKLRLPEVVGNESWRPALENWETCDGAALARCPEIYDVPGNGFNELLEATDSAGVRDSYLSDRITRLRFEIKRAGGALMKPIATREDREMGLYVRSLESHLDALLTGHPDHAFAARVRETNLPPSKI